MAATRSTNGLFMVPAKGDRNWNTQLAAALATLDALEALGQFSAYATLIDGAGNPTSLSLTVEPGTYVTTAGAVAAFAGGSVTVSASATTYVWVAQTSNTLATGTSFPTTACVRVAVVVAGASAITSVTPARVVYRAFGT